ncbi:ABC transporter permease [Microlunatus speluncae]|uniref:ABC transporter permease n=1 Tax=Microlunatus speluncae TaxID=2594267 RepID=UPI0012663886|nr:ABC transporter permease [Microlunatus speluncae]
MTAPAVRSVRRGPADGGLEGTGFAVRLGLRRNRGLVIGAVLFLVLLGIGTALQYARTFPTDTARREFAAEVGGNAALTAFTGQLQGDSLGALVVWKIGDILYLLVSLIAILIVIRQTRAEEETGRLELIRASTVGRHASWLSGLIIGLIVVVAAAGLIGLGMITLGTDVVGSVAFAAAIASAGSVATVLAVITAQLTERSRGATVIAAVVLGLAYLTRFVADGSGLLGLRWLSFTGWSHLVAPYGDEQGLVLVLPLLVGAAGVALAARMADRRDLGSGVIRPRPGPDAAAPGLAGPFGLAWRLQRGFLAGWLAACGALALATAGVAAGMPELADRGGPQVTEFLNRYADHPGASIADTFVWMIIVSIAGTVALYPVLVLARVRAEESNGLAELTLSTTISRLRWAGAHLIIALAGTAVIMTVSGLAAGLSYGVTSGTGPVQVGRVLAAAAIQIPAIWVLAGVIMFAIGVLPRIAVAVGWAAWVFVNVFGESLGPIIGLRYAVANAVIPFAYVSKIITGATLQLTPLIVLVLITVALATVGLLVLRRRDIRPA